MSTLAVDAIENLAGDNRFGPIEMTAVSASGTAVDFTGIPSWVKKITVSVANLSGDGSSNIIVQIGDSGGLETSGYLGVAAALGASTAGSTMSSGFEVRQGVAASVMHGFWELRLLDSATNSWVSCANVGSSDNSFCYPSAGSKALSATLDRVRLTTVGGTVSFDAGTVGVMYE
jgi:hypothetical protein